MKKNGTDFEKAAKQAGNKSTISELIGLLKETKKWWMLPIIITVLILGALILLGGTGAAPFIYTLF